MAKTEKQPVNLKIAGDHTHSATTTTFPELWSGFHREEVISYDMKDGHVGISYVQQISKKSKAVLSLCLYPHKHVDNQQLRDEFYSYHDALNKNSNTNIELKPSFGNLSNNRLKINYIYSVFNNSIGQRDFFKEVKYVSKIHLFNL